MASFELAIIRPRKNEGYLNTRLSDGQTITYAGITLESDRDWEGWPIFFARYGEKYRYVSVKGKMVKIGDYPQLKEEQKLPELEPFVNAYYKRKYWTAIKGESIRNQEVANLLLSFAIASGKWCPQTKIAINKALGFKPTHAKGLTEDYNWTDKAIAYLNQYPSEIYDDIYRQRLAYMKGLSIWERFKSSWNRMMSMFPETIQKPITFGSKLAPAVLLIAAAYIVGNAVRKLF